MKNSKFHFKNDIIVLKDRIIQFDGLKESIKLKKRKDIKNVKQKRVRCDICKIDIHNAPYAKHSKTKKHLENIQQNKVIIPRIDPI